MDRLDRIQGQLEQLPISIRVFLGTVVLGLLYAVLTGERPHASIPVVTLDRKRFEALLPAQFSWFQHGKALLAKGLHDCPSCFQVRASSGYKIVVPNRFAEELRSDPSLSLNENFAKDFFIDYPGFDGHRQGLKDGSIIHEVVRTKLTQSLGMITNLLIEETIETLQDILGDGSQWQTRLMKDDIADVVARLTSRVFLGSELCRNKAWLEVAKTYAMDSFVAQNHLRMCPAPLRPILHWIIPSCVRLRKGVRDARRLINSEVQVRRKRAEEAIQPGQKPPKEADAIGWMVEVSRGKKIDHVGCQLSLSILAIFSTSETLTRGILQLCATPEIVQPLREEMIRVLQTEGWSKKTIGKMRLLDSFLKEVQRTRCLDLTSMKRMIKQPFTLSDGTVLPAGSQIMVCDNRSLDPQIFPEPDRFDVTRFLRLREQPGQENYHQLVTPSPTLMAFGYGQHACPGRFFASNEVKIALCCMLLKYDFRLVPGVPPPRDLEFETATTCDPGLRIQVRRRQEDRPYEFTYECVIVYNQDSNLSMPC